MATHETSIHPFPAQGQDAKTTLSSIKFWNAWTTDSPRSHPARFPDMPNLLPWSRRSKGSEGSPSRRTSRATQGQRRAGNRFALPAKFC